MKPHAIIHIQPDAPAKPAQGAPCNGCGVCCLAEPCPLGAVLSGRRLGACDALRWDAAARRYRCGMLTDTAQVLRQHLPRWLRGLAVGAPLWARLSRRWIAAGQGCDSSLVVEIHSQSRGQSPE